MRLKTKQYAKLAATSLIAAFSFGLAISCVSNHKQNINKVFAEDDISTTWSYNLNNKALSCTYASNYPNGFIMETNQVSVTGLGEGQYELAYHVLGYPSNSVQPDYTDYGIFTLVFISGSYDSTASEDRPYGSITACPLDVSGLDSETEYEIYLKVEPTGDMNEQGSGEGDDENAGIWTWNQNTQKLSFQFNETATAGYVSTTSQTMVYGHGNGTFDIGYDLYGTPAGATSASNDLLASKTIRLYDGYFNENTATVTGNSSEVAGLESYGQITVAVDVTPSGDLNTDGWRVNDGQLYFYVLADENPASIDSITWNNSSGNGTGEAILSVTISTNGGSFQQVYQINYPTFNPELEGTSGTTLGNTTVEGISEFSDREVTIDISNVTYSLGESTQEVRYTITYYPNGADGEPTNDFTGQVVEGDIAEYMLLENMFSRPDYIFLGWSEDSSSQTPSYEEGEKVYLRSDISYYAVWEYQEPEYYTREICFDPANGDNYITRVVEGETLPLSYEISEDLTPTYEGHTFLGWYYEGIIYQPGEVIRDINESIVLVAKWEEVAQEIRYTITYYPNGADGEPSTFKRETSLVEGDSDYVSYEFEQQPENYTRSGYSFAGWSIDSNAEEAEYLPNVSYSINQDLEVFAVWVEVSQEYSFEVLFVANDGTDNSRRTTFTAPYETTSYELPSITDIGFTFPGHEFIGWSLTSDGDVISGATVISSGTTSFYAIWISTGPKYQYTVTFDGNGATSGSTDPVILSGDDYSQTIVFPECGYEREGYIFKGWGFNSEAIMTYKPGEERNDITADTTFYAIWVELFDITFDANGGTGNMEAISVKSGTTSIVPGCEFVREGYSFAGWAVNSPDSETIVQPEDSVSVNQDYVLYALWELDGPKYQYTVTFDGNGATSGSTDPVILSGDDYSQTIVFPECGYEREGYIFKGWGFNSEAIITYKPGEERTDITSDTTFYAIWTQVFTISFDANGGDGIMETITIPEGNATMPECAFTREGYSFAGWAVGSPTGDVYQAGASVYVSANYVLYATWEAITPITDIEISVAESEVVLYVDDSYIIQYTVTPEGAAGELIWKVEDEKVAAVIEDGMLVGLSVGSTTVTISDRSGNTSVSFVVYVVERPVPVQPENPISEETVEQINDAMDTMELTGGQIDRINEAINTNSDYLSDEAGSVIYEALLGTTIDYDDPIVAEAQKELVVTVVETAVQVDAGKATSISEAQEIDKALPETANFSVEGEIDEFYQRQMYELFGGTKPSRLITRAGVPTYEINTDTDGKSGQEGADYLKDQQALYEKMVDFVDDSVDHMGKAALKLRKCSGESVTVSVKSYVTVVKVSSFREFDKEAADKEFVEACYKAILLSMQNQVISILEKEHKPSGNAEKEEQYKKELEAVKDIETFEIMVSEVLRQKYVALTGEQIDDVEDFQPIYWEIFKAWALDMPSPYPITLEELTQTTIEQSTGRAKAFTVNSNLTAGEWGFIAGIAGGSALIIAASAVIPTLLKKKKSKGGR